jgi:hypothetical protein
MSGTLNRVIQLMLSTLIAIASGCASQDKSLTPAEAHAPRCGIPRECSE